MLHIHFLQIQNWLLKPRSVVAPPASHAPPLEGGPGVPPSIAPLVGPFHPSPKASAATVAPPEALAEATTGPVAISGFRCVITYHLSGCLDVWMSSCFIVRRSGCLCWLSSSPVRPVVLHGVAQSLGNMVCHLSHRVNN